MKNGFLKTLDYFFVLRPTLFYPVWTVGLAGYWAQERTPGTAALPHAEWQLLFFFIALTLVLGASFLVNQIADMVSDRINNKLYLIANGAISTRSAWIETTLLTLAPMLAMAVWRKDLAWLLLAAFLVTGWAYSVRPLTLKDRPWGGMIANLLGALIIFAYGWCANGTCDLALLRHAVPYLLAILAVYFYTTIPDRKGDQAAAKITVAVTWGTGKTRVAGLLADLAAMAAALWVVDWLILSAATLSLPFFILACIRKTDESVLRTNKFAILFLTLFICIRFPAYLALAVALYFFSKWYYRRRFNVTYPSLHT